MQLVIIESPYAGDIQANVLYARQCLRHSIDLGEAPFASHLIYPQTLDDSDPKERSRGIQAGYEWMSVATLVAFYIDLGWSPGMLKALKMARAIGKPVTARRLNGKVDVSRALAYATRESHK